MHMTGDMDAQAAQEAATRLMAKAGSAAFVPETIRANARRGVAWYLAGRGAPGLDYETVRVAREIAAGRITGALAIRMAEWFPAHMGDLDSPGAQPGHPRYPSPVVVAHALRGGGTRAQSRDTLRWARNHQPFLSKAVPTDLRKLNRASATTLARRLLLAKADVTNEARDPAGKWTAQAARTNAHAVAGAMAMRTIGDGYGGSRFTPAAAQSRLEVAAVRHAAEIAPDAFWERHAGHGAIGSPSHRAMVDDAVAQGPSFPTAPGLDRTPNLHLDDVAARYPANTDPSAPYPRYIDAERVPTSPGTMRKADVSRESRDPSGRWSAGGPAGGPAGPDADRGDLERRRAIVQAEHARLLEERELLHGHIRSLDIEHQRALGRDLPMIDSEYADMGDQDAARAIRQDRERYVDVLREHDAGIADSHAELRGLNAVLSPPEPPEPDFLPGGRFASGNAVQGPARSPRPGDPGTRGGPPRRDVSRLLRNFDTTGRL